MEWKGKIFSGIIRGNPQEESKKSAQITRGMFISIPIVSDIGRIINMPFTSRAKYEVLDK
jgi:hypothetical protein